MTALQPVQMEERPVSIQDIARELGISHSTVSRALHDSTLISLEVRQLIQRTASEMGYTPNAVAQSLKGQRTRTIGLVVANVADPFVGRVVRGIEEVAQGAGLSVYLSASLNNPEREMSIIEAFHRQRVDGIISASAQISDRYVARLTQVKVPIVLVNRQAESEHELLRNVDVDDYDGARKAVAHLIELGHRDIGFIGAGNRPRSNRRRLEGWCDAMQSAGLVANESWMRIAPPEHRYHSDDVADGRALMEELLQTGITAVFCYNDMIAVGVLMTCRERGIAVPAQLSVIGFDDIELAQYVTPPLTTMHQPKLRLGQLAMEMLLDLLEGRSVENVTLPTELIQRASTARAC